MSKVRMIRSMIRYLGRVNKNSKGLEFQVIDYKDAKNITVEFKESGAIVKCQTHQFNDGTVIDPLHRSVYGIGYTGVGKYNTKHKTYNIWYLMFRRCYGKIERTKNYDDCEVDERWHNFQVFAEWYTSNYPDREGIFDLDKDIKIDGNRIYGPDTCLIVTRGDNARKATEKFRKPIKIKHIETGEIITVTNKAEFCRDRNVNLNAFYLMTNGKKKECFGYEMA